MRGTRWLLLVVIAAILSGVWLTYRAQKKVLRDQAPPKPAALSTELSSSAEHWHYRITDLKTGRVLADIDAGDFRQVKDSSRVDLNNVTMKIYSKDGASYDLVHSAAAQFFTSDQHLYSDGQVEMTLGVPVEGQARRTLVSIKSSGVTFDSATNRVETDRAASFVFDNGEGTGTGAFYDPATHELRIKSDVKLDWKPAGTPSAPNPKPLKIEATSLAYHEAISEIWLKPWGRLTRENTVVEGEHVVVHLQDSVTSDGQRRTAIRQVEASKAHGSDTYPNRKLEYSAGELWVDFDDDSEVRKITGQTNARLVAVSEASETTVSAYHVEMDFDTGSRQSLLSHVAAAGDGVLTSKPLPAPGRQPGETHVLRSNQIEMKMRPGGREIDTVVTHAPGKLEFLPNLPAQHHRTLDGKDLFIAYGPQNRIESFRAAGVRTQTDPTAEERRRNRAPFVTTSRDLLARFDPQTGRLASMEQRGDFAYEEGDRKARAAQASLDEGQDVIVLETSARVWDATSSTSADHIRLDQRTGDFTAEGNVNSSRLPDKDQKKSSELLSGDQPLQAQARKMVSANRNRAIHYEGGAAMWQGANRIQADTIDVDREKRTLVAGGNVVTNLWEEPKPPGPQPPAPGPQPPAPVLTVAHAARLVYTEQDRLAVYTGGALLTRPGLQVKGREIRAFLAESGTGSRLQKALADGAVEIVQATKDRAYTLTGEHAEYYTDEQKVILRGGRPKLVESVKGAPPNTTEGEELIYYANDDRLTVNGVPKQPAESRIVRKKK